MDPGRLKVGRALSRSMQTMTTLPWPSVAAGLHTAAAIPWPDLAAALPEASRAPIQAAARVPWGAMAAGFRSAAALPWADLNAAVYWMTDGATASERDAAAAVAEVGTSELADLPWGVMWMGLRMAAALPWDGVVAGVGREKKAAMEKLRGEMIQMVQAVDAMPDIVGMFIELLVREM